MDKILHGPEKTLEEVNSETYDRKAHFEIEEMGARLNDFIRINPAMGVKRNAKINRPRIRINVAKCFVGEINPGSITLPLLGGEQQSFELALVYPNTANEDEDGRYMMKALSNIPFRLNGRYVFKAFIERGDMIELGYNRLYFNYKNTVKKNITEHKILSHKKILLSKLPILIEGETGTGKSLLAQEIHEKSSRIGPFIQLNLASFSKGLLESELFGHVKGAFTGAIGEKRGAVMEANKGTLFLDEIDSLPLGIQTKLLLFLDNMQFRPVGGSFHKTANVRFIFATGRPLEKLVESGEMRKDFYYRLNSGEKIKLLNLRENHFLIEKFCAEFMEKKSCSLSKDLIKFYLSCSWYGNYRQLKGHLEKKLLYGHGNNLKYDALDEELHLGPHYDIEDEGFLSLEKMKQKYALKVFQYFDKNITKSAEVLEITKTTCRKMVRP